MATTEVKENLLDESVARPAKSIRNVTIVVFVCYIGGYHLE
jgi:hypothetical protein